MAVTMQSEGVQDAEAPVCLPYQQQLRSVGAYLDEQEASQIFVLETDDGFLVRYHRHQAASDIRSVHLGPVDLMARDWRLKGRRTPKPDKSAPADSGRYQDLLRALGYELEQIAARQVVLDELDGTYVLTYQHPDAKDTPVLRKHRTIITPAEAEELLRRARARRRPTKGGWLLHSSEVASGPVHVVPLTHIDARLDRSPCIVYEYTIPALTERAAESLRRADLERQQVYRGQRAASRGPLPPSASVEEQMLKPYEAARLISTVYARCLDPLRFTVAGREAVGKDQVVATFAHALTAGKVLAAVQLVAGSIDVIRSLDEYQAGLGTNTVRWMQHLAAEALDGVATGPSNILPEQGRLDQALRSIRSSVTVADRFAAIRRAVHLRPPEMGRQLSPA